MGYALKKTVAIMLGLVVSGMTAPLAASNSDAAVPAIAATAAAYPEPAVALDPAMTTESVAALTAAEPGGGRAAPSKQPASANLPALVLVVLILVLLLEATGITGLVKRRSRAGYGSANGADVLGMRTA